MQDLTISWASGTKTFSPADSPVTLGRSLESSVVVSDLTASRRHVIFSWSGDSWVAEDISTHGCFSSLGSTLGKNWVLSHDQSIRLGDPDGQDIEISVISSSDEAAAVPPVPAPENQMTTVFEEPAQAQGAKSNPFPAAQVDVEDLGAPPLPPSGSLQANNGGFESPDVPAPSFETPASPSFESPGMPDPVTAFEAPQPPTEPLETPDMPAEPIFETPDVPAPNFETPETPEVPSEPIFETPETPEVPDVPAPNFETPETPEVPDVPAPNFETPETPEVPSEPIFETPDVPAPNFETPETPEVPDVPAPNFETPETPEVPSEPIFETPETPEVPSEPIFETPETPEVPDVPAPNFETPETPEVPSEPIFETPETPEVLSEPIFETPDSPPLPPSPIDPVGDVPDLPPLPPTPDIETGTPEPAAPFAADMTVRDPNPAAPPTTQTTPEPFSASGQPTVSNQPEIPPVGQPTVPHDPQVPNPAPANNAFATQPNAFQPNTEPTFGQPAGGGAHWAAEPSTTAIVDNTIRVEVDNKDYTFQPHEEVTIGRDQNCSVVLDKRHALASRQHVRMTYRDNAWWMEDFSSKGTFVDGSPIKNPYRATGGFKALLGNKQAGTEVKIVAPGEHVPNRKNRLPIYIAIGAAVALLFAAITGGILVTRDSEEAVETTISSEILEAQFLEQAKKSSAMIIADTEEGISTGSGFFVSETLIVTNQHVVDGDDLLEVAISTGNDDPVQLTYVATILENHPFLDIAVLQLTGELVPAEEADADDNLVAGLFTIEALGPPKTEFVEVGSSEDLVLGTRVFTTGFPGSLNSVGRNDAGDVQLPPVGTSSGNAASYDIWPGCNNPSADSKIPQGSPSGVQCNTEGDVKNAVVTTTFTSGPGASGSPVYQDGKVIGVVFSGTAGEIESNASRSITSTSFMPWLDPIIEAN